MLRAGTRDEGTVMCFVKSGSSKASAKDALESFARTGELGGFGQLRYAYVKNTTEYTVGPRGLVGQGWFRSSRRP